MYPKNYFNLFPPFPRDDKIFVAMSFDEIFTARWQNVIKPAIRSVEIGGKRLEPHRVDTRKVSDSILTEILTGISKCRLFFADLTTIGKINGQAIRNGNVMYEVGLAHATRLPEEVLLFRSDSDPLLFDVSNIRVNSYDPAADDSKAAELIRLAAIDALREIDLKKNLAVKSVAESLDYTSWSILLEASSSDGIFPPLVNTMGQALSNTSRLTAISRLLEFCALSTAYLQITPELLADHNRQLPAENMVRYRITPFGEAIVGHIAERMNLLKSEMFNLLGKFVNKEGT